MKEKFPEIGELVVCSVTGVKNFGAFVTLDEYGGREGFIHIAEVATGWIKYIRDYVREKQRIVCKVQNVDQAKGHIDLSLKAVNDHQKREKIQLWKNEVKAEKLVQILGEKIGWSVEECHEKFSDKLVETYGTLYRALEEASLDPEQLKKDGFKGPWMEAFLAVAKENIVPTFVRIDGYLELTCYSDKGVRGIREALGKAAKEGDTRIQIQYIGAPRYRLVVEAPDYKEAEEILAEASQKVIKAITGFGGEGQFHRKE